MTEFDNRKTTKSFAWGDALTLVSCMTALLSVWLTWHGFQESRFAELSGQRLSACIETVDRASGVIVAELRRECRNDGVGCWGGDYYGEEATCAERDENCQAALRARAEAAREYWQRELRAARIEFEAAQRFALLGPVELARAEEALSVAIREPIDSDRAETALRTFRNSCAMVLGGFGEAATQTPRDSGER